MGLDLWKDELVKNITELTNRLNSMEEDNLELKQDNLELKSQVKILIQEQEECKNNYTRGIEMVITINISKFSFELFYPNGNLFSCKLHF